MSPRPRGPALYELVRDREEPPPARAVPTPEPRPSTPIPATPAPSVWPAVASRSIRIPAGYMFLALAGLIAAALTAYTLGFSRGKSSERADRIQAEPPISAPFDTPTEPSSALPSPGASRQPTTSAQPQRTPNQPANTPANTPNTIDPHKPATSTASSSDPRTPGLNYFIIARLSPPDAQKAADYLSSNGVAASVVPSDNLNFRHVVSNRGFSPSELRGPEYQKLLADIKRVGRAFKKATSSPTDFADAYPSKFNP